MMKRAFATSKGLSTSYPLGKKLRSWSSFSYAWMYIYIIYAYIYLPICCIYLYTYIFMRHDPENRWHKSPQIPFSWSLKSAIAAPFGQVHHLVSLTPVWIVWYIYIYVCVCVCYRRLILRRRVICPTWNEQDTNEPDFQLHIIDVLAGQLDLRFSFQAERSIYCNAIWYLKWPLIVETWNCCWKDKSEN